MSICMPMADQLINMLDKRTACRRFLSASQYAYISLWTSVLTAAVIYYDIIVNHTNKHGSKLIGICPVGKWNMFSILRSLHNRPRLITYSLAHEELTFQIKWMEWIFQLLCNWIEGWLWWPIQLIHFTMTANIWFATWRCFLLAVVYTPNTDMWMPRYIRSSIVVYGTISSIKLSWPWGTLDCNDWLNRLR